MQSKLLKNVRGNVQCVASEGDCGVEWSGKLLSSSKLRFPPRRMEMRVPTPQGNWEDEMPSVKALTVASTQ